MRHGRGADPAGVRARPPASGRVPWPWAGSAGATLPTGGGGGWGVVSSGERAGAEARALCALQLRRRGVSLDQLARLVLDLQRAFVPGLCVEECAESVDAVLSKREVCNALLTGIALDELAEQGLLPEPLCGTVLRDDPLFGIDEVLALSIVNIYGSIGFTNFGYLDKVKPGVVGLVDRGGNGSGRCNTFLDDLIAAVAAAAASRIAHRHRDTLGEEPPTRGERALDPADHVAGGGEGHGPGGTG
jgi:phosphatidylglycerophosphatase A